MIKEETSQEKINRLEARIYELELLVEQKNGEISDLEYQIEKLELDN